MRVEIDPAVAPYLVAAIKSLARQMARDGYPVPAELLTLAETLAVSPAERRRGRNTRYRQRQAEAARRQLSA